MANAIQEIAIVHSEAEPKLPQHNQQEEPNQAGPSSFSGPNQGGPHFSGPGPNNRRPRPMHFENRRPQGPFPQQGRGENNFNRRRQGGPPGPNHNEQGMHNINDKFNEKLQAISGPTYDLPPLDTSEIQFSGKTRLYIGNISNEVSPEDLTRLFNPFGETSELFVNKEKNFAFIRVDCRANAEKAKRELDGSLFKGRNLKIRFAPNGSTIKVKNLPNFVSNELLYCGFQIFGEIERALVLVDERGKPTGEGIVQFVRKGCALNAVRKCDENCFFLTGVLQPCIVEIFDPVDDFDGYPERFIPKKNPEYMKIREIGPHFARINSFEYQYGTRWKQMFELFAQKEQALKKEFDVEKARLEALMVYAKFNHETEMMRDELHAREMDHDRHKHEFERKNRLAEERKQRNDEQMRRQQEEIQASIMLQDEEMRIRQQNNPFLQGQLENMIEQEDTSYEPPPALFNNMPDDNVNSPVEPKAFMNSYKRNNNHRFEGPRDMGPNGPRNGGGRGRWVSNDNRRDDFPSKRRRF